MAKNWWFKLDWDDWLTDGELSACSLETQGFWMRCVCLMNRADVYELTGTIEQLRRKLGVLPEELTRCLHDLKTNNAANVRFGNGDVSIISRRRQKELKAKENNRLYVAKHRAKDECKIDVRTQSKSKSKSYIKTSEADAEIETFPEPRKEHFKRQLNLTPINPSLDLELNTWLGAVAVAVGAKDARSLSKFKKWEQVCMTAIQEQRDLGKFLKVIESEKERNRGQEQFFSPDTCLQTLQLNGSVKQSKWTHEV